MHVPLSYYHYGTRHRAIVAYNVAGEQALALYYHRFVQQIRVQTSAFIAFFRAGNYSAGGTLSGGQVPKGPGRPLGGVWRQESLGGSQSPLPSLIPPPQATQEQET